MDLIATVKRSRNHLGWHVYEFANGLVLWEAQELCDGALAGSFNRAMVVFAKCR